MTALIPIESLDYARDAESLHRLWAEIGWLDADPKQRIVQETLAACSDGRVARINGDVKALAPRWRARCAISIATSRRAAWPA